MRAESASREIFSNRGRAAGRKAAYAAGASRENRCTYGKARQDRQFLQTDPVGYEDDLNLYAYVRNDPLSSRDPSGEETIVDLIGYTVGRLPNGEERGHAAVRATDTETGAQYIFRGGPSGEYPRGPFDIVSNVGYEGNAEGEGRVTLFNQVNPAADSPDTDYARDAGGWELLQSSNLGDTPLSDAVRGLERTRDELNQSDTVYRPQTDNSNLSAGTAFEDVTGDYVDENPKYPGLLRRLPE